MSSITAAGGNADPGDAAPALGEAVLRERLKAYATVAGRLTALLEDAGGDWHPAGRLAEDVAAAADELGFHAMANAAGKFAAAVRQGASLHALRNLAQLIVVEHERWRETSAGSLDG